MLGLYVLNKRSSLSIIAVLTNSVRNSYESLHRTAKQAKENIEFSSDIIRLYSVIDQRNFIYFSAVVMLRCCPNR